MDEIELDNLGEDQPIEPEEGEEETDMDWDKSVIIMSGMNPDLRQGLEEEKQADRELGKIQGLRNRGYTEDKKNLLKELGISLNKGDGPFAKSIFDHVKRNWGKQTFTYHAANDWNSLPVELRQIEPFTSFKIKLKKHLTQ